MNSLLEFIAAHPWFSWAVIATITGIPGAILHVFVRSFMDKRCPLCAGLGEIPRKKWQEWEARR